MMIGTGADRNAHRTGPQQERPCHGNCGCLTGGDDFTADQSGVCRAVMHRRTPTSRPLEADSFQKCCKAGLDLHHAVLSNEYLKVYCELVALSAEIILTLLRYSGLPNESDEPESLQPEIVRVFDNTASLTIKWLEDVYGQKFTFYQTRTKTFSLEMQAWSLILNTGEKVTPKWKASLLPVLCRKINQPSGSGHRKQEYRIDIWDTGVAAQVMGWDTGVAAQRIGTLDTGRTTGHRTQAGHQEYRKDIWDTGMAAQVIGWDMDGTGPGSGGHLVPSYGRQAPGIRPRKELKRDGASTAKLELDQTGLAPHGRLSTA
ncbi:unnamed protein product [Ranitomeya imitator]|uniref:Uncharacterized protein n=1 Tax=Ranitomeya imitator TaxID=111125 RepID=A0ABN9KXT9_9NEOB|nr:unnamed protein product [Ranitomeya imitator]